MNGQSKGPGVTTGALLDSGNDGSYCTHDLADQLHAKGELVTLSFGTITDKGKEVTTEEFDLKFTGIGTWRNHSIPLCKVLVVSSLPSSPKSSIARNGDIVREPNLQDISPTCIPGGVDFLISLATPQALLQLEVRTGGNGEPFATRTLLGCIINRPIRFEDGGPIGAMNICSTGMTTTAQRQQDMIRHGSVLGMWRHYLDRRPKGHKVAVINCAIS